MIKKSLNEIKKKGWTKIKGVFDKKVIEEIKSEFEKNKYHFYDLQKKRGLAKEAKNSTHHTILKCKSLLKVLKKNKTSEILTKFFNGKYILSTIGISQIPSNGGVYTQNIHRDIRSFDASSNLWINTLIMLDDSTSLNGATWMLEGSHMKAQKPNKEFFYKNAVRATGKAGDVLIFNGNIWHAAGENTSNHTRTIITPIYCKPYIKQQLDYPRALGLKFGAIIDENQRQLLGYNAMTPQSLEEFYQKKSNRFYQSDQG